MNKILVSMLSLHFQTVYFAKSDASKPRGPCFPSLHAFLVWTLGVMETQ